MLPGAAFGRNIIVDGDNPGGGALDCGFELSGQPGQSANPCNTIQLAVNQTVAGDVVIVRQMRSGNDYTESVDTNTGAGHPDIQINGVPCVPATGSPCTDTPGRPTVDPPDGADTEGFNVATSGVTVSNFIVTDAEGANACGINVTGSEFTGSGNTLGANTIGLCLAANGASILSNQISGNNQAGTGTGNGILSTVEVDDTVISGNGFSQHNTAAVNFTDAGTDRDNLNIVGNTSDGDGAAFDLSRVRIGVFGDNTVRNAAGDALFLFDVQDLGILDNTIDNAGGSAIRIVGDTATATPVESDGLSVLGNALTDSTDYGLFADGGTDSSANPVSDSITVRANRIVGNDDGIRVVDVGSPETPRTDAEQNYFGCNEGPNLGACDSVSGNVDFSPWLVLTLLANPGSATVPGGDGFTVDFNHLSNGGSATSPALFPPTEVTISETSGPAGSDFGSSANPNAPGTSFGQGPLNPVTSNGAVTGNFIRSTNAGLSTLLAEDPDVTDVPDSDNADAESTDTVQFNNPPAPPPDTDNDDDGLSNSAEAAIGTNPNSADTDGDGVGDNADRCPTTAAPGTADGCPAVAAARVNPRALTLGVSPGSDSRKPFKFQAKGKLRPPVGMSAADGCQGVVAIRFTRGSRLLTTKYRELNGKCSYKANGLFNNPGASSGSIRVRAEFGGNDLLRGIRSSRVSVGFGRR